MNIIVRGTIRSPLIKLTSEPELGRSDIISVILYDRTSDQVRKRVTKQWVLTASWEPATEEKSQSGKLVLQWEKRF